MSAARDIFTPKVVGLVAVVEVVVVVFILTSE